MSGIAGIYGRHGQAVDLDELERIVASPGMQQLAPGGYEGMSRPPVALACGGGFQTGQSGQRVRSPHVTSDGLILTFEGQLHNGDEVRRALGVRRDLDSTHLDLVIGAYRRWGINGFAHLIGEFAFALWDPHSAHLILCRDSLGQHALYYHVGTDQLSWASRCRPLVDGLALPHTFDEEFIAAYLLGWKSERSPFRDVLPVPAGHVIVAQHGRVEQQRYWTPDPNQYIRYSSDAEYGEHLARLLREAVRCRIDSVEPVFCELSGGLDSSAIVCIADQLCKTGEVPTPSIRTVSHVFDNAATADERPYIGMVEEHIGRRGLHISERECPILSALPSSLYADLPTGQLCYIARQDHVTQVMHQSGAHVLLSGIGGDQLFWSGPPEALPLADRFMARDYIAVVRQAGAWAGALRWPFLKTVWQGAIWPNLPERWRAATQSDDSIGEWLHPDFASRQDLRLRSIVGNGGGGFSRPSQSLQYRLIGQGTRTEALQWVSSVGHVDKRHPLLDRRIVEFALAVPIEQSVRPGRNRIVFRDALDGVLPEPIRQRYTKAGPSEALFRALAREWQPLTTMARGAAVAQHGFIRGDAFMAALKRARHGVITNQVQLQRTLALELWLRSLERGAGAQGRPASHPSRGEGQQVWRDQIVQYHESPSITSLSRSTQ